MKLSEAIRKGCEATHKNCNSDLFAQENGSIGACALGAALYGRFPDMKIDIRREGEYYDKIQETFPLTCIKINSLPIELLPKELLGYGRRSKLLNAIYFLNDRDYMSREAIAMWVETIEDYLESVKVTTDEIRLEEGYLINQS